MDGVHDKALQGMFDDMDDFESKKMFGDKEPQDANSGVDITISVSPKGGDMGDDHDIAMCKGGCAMHSGGTVPKPTDEADIFSGYDKEIDPEYKKGEVGMANGGIVPGETDDFTLPPFLRKKKKS